MLLRDQMLLLLTTLFSYAMCNQTNPFYNSTKEVCCDDTVHVKPSNESNDYRCCGSQLLLKGQSVCCDNGTIFPLDKHNVTGEYDEWGCCKSGDQVNLYNTETQRCCNGNVIDIGGNCRIECCGNTTYDSRKGKCCDNVVHDTGYPSMYGCCGNTTFEKSKGVCCNNVVHITGNSDMCCGGQPYNDYTHLCCSLQPGKTLDKNDLFKRKPQLKLHRLPDYKWARLEHGCCGLQIYNTESKVCCGGVLHQFPANSSYGCCGTKLINNTDKEICCPGDIVRARDNKYQYCCGDHVISSTANVSCCMGLGIVYNPTTDVCCGNSLLPRPFDYGKSSTGMCCRPYVYK